MKVTIEITETNINTIDQYKIESYPKSGIYLITNEAGDKHYMIALVDTGLMLAVGSENQAKQIFSNIDESNNGIKAELQQTEQLVSEAFALKMLAITLNQEKFNDVK